MKTGDAIAEILKREGVDTIIGYPVNRIFETAAAAIPHPATNNHPARKPPIPSKALCTVTRSATPIAAPTRIRALWNMLHNYRGKVNLEFAKMLWRFPGNPPVAAEPSRATTERPPLISPLGRQVGQLLRPLRERFSHWIQIPDYCEPRR